ncbi:MAG TPA: hypothetical protein VJ843_00765 [Candidatus Saccharimonadales bacterium]|nr:hypothetical protein [Candidatus Saccharimonadales bacterium]
MSRLVRVTALGLGVAALLTTAFTQGVTTSTPPTTQAVAPISTITPITPGLVPAQKPTSKPKSTSSADDANTLYDYINPCALVPLDEIHTITHNHRLLFQSKNGLTDRLSNAVVATNTEEGEIGQADCFLTSNLDYVKPQLLIGVVPDMLKVEFGIRYTQQNHDDNTVMWAERVPTRNLPGADSAYMTYAVVRGERLYQELFVHTKTGQMLEVLRPNKRQLHELAVAALRTLNGSRYPGK